MTMATWQVGIGLLGWFYRGRQQNYYYYYYYYYYLHPLAQSRRLKLNNTVRWLSLRFERSRYYYFTHTVLSVLFITLAVCIETARQRPMPKLTLNVYFVVFWFVIMTEQIYQDWISYEDIWNTDMQKYQTRAQVLVWYFYFAPQAISDVRMLASRYICIVT